ncbi:hypothetical protein [Nocardia salmonicida]|uniref:hypothetical protein n=1 Tax=Nocardia salmonicida TaxID=53431 RepID=UPI000B138E90|nr:hypothetical protein [Nocardia salmonicida]
MARWRRHLRPGYLVYLPTLLEIEGPDESAVRQTAADLGLDYSQAKFGSVDTSYRTETDRDILAEPTLLFNDFAE